MKKPNLKFTFTDKINKERTCRVEYDWLGTEKYYIDDTLVKERWSIRGTAVNILLPNVSLELRTKIGLRTVIVHVFIDGEERIYDVLRDWSRENIQLPKKIEPTEKIDSRRKKGLSIIFWIAALFILFLYFKKNNYSEKSIADGSAIKYSTFKPTQLPKA